MYANKKINVVSLTALWLKRNKAFRKWRFQPVLKILAIFMSMTSRNDAPPALSHVPSMFERSVFLSLLRTGTHCDRYGKPTPAEENAKRQFRSLTRGSETKATESVLYWFLSARDSRLIQKRTSLLWAGQAIILKQLDSFENRRALTKQNILESLKELVIPSVLKMVFADLQKKANILALSTKAKPVFCMIDMMKKSQHRTHIYVSMT